jgi:hypothetical protein
MFGDSAPDWISFLVVGLLLTGLLAILTKRRISQLIRVATIVVIAIVVYGLTVIEGPVHLGEQLPWYQASPYREIILFVFMIFGMMARVLSAAIEERRNRMRDGTQAPGLNLDFWESTYPLLFSVITFGALLTQVGDNNLGVTVIVLAFQTGFFWQTIIKQPRS